MTTATPTAAGLTGALATCRTGVNGGLHSGPDLAQPWAKHVTTAVELMGQKCDNETSPRRCANTVIPGALTVRYEGASG